MTGTKKLESLPMRFAPPMSMYKTKSEVTAPVKYALTPSFSKTSDNAFACRADHPANKNRAMAPYQ